MDVLIFQRIGLKDYRFLHWIVFELVKCFGWLCSLYLNSIMRDTDIHIFAMLDVFILSLFKTSAGMPIHRAFCFKDSCTPCVYGCTSSPRIFPSRFEIMLYNIRWHLLHVFPSMNECLPISGLLWALSWALQNFLSTRITYLYWITNYKPFYFCLYFKWYF